MGPILLDNVTCSQSHLELLECVHRLEIGIHNCDRENVAGVVCPSVSAITTATTDISPNITSTETTPQNISTLFFVNSTLLTTSLSSLDLLATNTQ